MIYIKKIYLKALLKNIFFIFILITTMTTKTALSITDNKKTFSLHNSSLVESIRILEIQYKYEIDYKGPLIDKKLNIVINDLTIEQSLKKILSDFNINNWTSYTDKSRNSISIRTLSSDSFTNDGYAQQLSLKVIPKAKDVSTPTKEDIYLLREHSEKEEQKQRLLDEKFTFEEIYFIEKNNKIKRQNDFFDLSTLTPADIKQLPNERESTEIYPSFSPRELELMKKDTQTKQDKIESIITDKEIKILQNEQL